MLEALRLSAPWSWIVVLPASLITGFLIAAALDQFERRRENRKPRGGIVGRLTDKTIIENCYTFSGKTTANYIGGIVGICAKDPWESDEPHDFKKG